VADGGHFVSWYIAGPKIQMKSEEKRVFRRPQHGVGSDIEYRGKCTNRASRTIQT
jgi:hypothetical protein